MVRTIIYMLEFDVTSRRIEGGVSNRPSNPSKVQSGLLQVMDYSATRIPLMANKWPH